VAIFELKAFVNTITSKKLHCILLAILLTASSSAFSAHVSSHTPSDSLLCALCIHPGGPDTAIAQEPKPLFARQEPLIFILEPSPADVFSVRFHVHQSRAPPDLT